MTTQYSRNVLKVVVAQICQTIGWHSINSTPMEFMVDLMQEYIFQLAKLSQQYSQVLGRCEANLDDLGLAFQHMNIDLQELAEYIKNVEPVPCVISVPKLPIQRENHLNFLKPGSREVVTRPVHVHEHLPAMYPEAEEEYQTENKDTEAVDTNAVSQVSNTSEDETNENNNVITSNGTSSEDGSIKPGSQPVFKRPGDPISFDGPTVKKAKITEEGRPLREIHSVIMTTSGFLSTAREGKLPEARTPQQARSESPPPPLYPTIPPEVKVEKKVKKVSKKTEDGKPENKENKKKKIPKDVLFQPDEIKDVKVKKLAGTKDIAKVKGVKTGAKAGSANLAGPSNLPITTKAAGKIPTDSPKSGKSTLAANKLKTEKLDVSFNPINPLMNDRKDEPIDKLPIEPDKQKLNIFKKISSKSKEDKERDSLEAQHKIKDTGTSEIPHLVPDGEDRHRIDAIVKLEDKKSAIPPGPQIGNNIARTPDNSVTNMMSPGSDGYMFDMSPPRTPSTPKTPELSVSNVVPGEQKKKRKDKSGKKKESKIKAPKNTISPKKARLSNDSVLDLNVMDRPKTPQAPEQPHQPITPGSGIGTTRDPNLPSSLPFPFFPAFPPAPGLIPHPMFPLAAAAAAKGIPGMPAIPGAPNPAAMMLNQRLFRPKLDGSRPPFVPPSFINEPHHQHHQPLPQTPVFPIKQQPIPPLAKTKITRSPEKEMHLPKPVIQPFQTAMDLPQSHLINPVPMLGNPAIGVPAPLVPPMIPPVVPAPLLPTPALGMVKPPKLDKGEKSEKKSKEHKKEKKDKLKKKKEKKEKHKDKGEKIKEKKDKSEKKEKLEKIKEKKEKKEKKKEKEKEKEASKKLAKEEKAIESVPKITLKLGPAGGSPRPATPENALKKITIKPMKKPEDEAVKREPTPELARISALVTRPPKQKTSKKAEGVHESYAAPPTPSLYCPPLTHTFDRAKKPVFKTLPHREPSPPVSFSYTESYSSLKPLDNKQFCYMDASGQPVWICPACGKQDDGSPMIGCDDCDAWYHWVCVGIQVEPADNEDWYCSMCIAKKQEQYQDKKKKKRKKKMKVSA